jgi:hypothetical protein
VGVVVQDDVICGGEIEDEVKDVNSGEDARKALKDNDGEEGTGGGVQDEDPDDNAEDVVEGATNPGEDVAGAGGRDSDRDGDGDNHQCAEHVEVSTSSHSACGELKTESHISVNR